jgi:prepilin-type N-terminal cleavage/methylation domain-containing protein
MKQDKGFSLTELAIAIAIIAIMGAIAVPTISTTMRNLQSRTDARNIATALTVAKLKATSQLTRYQLVFDLSHNQWRTEKFNKATGEYEIDGAVATLAKEDADYRVAFQTSSSPAPTGFSTTSSHLIRFNSRGVPVSTTSAAVAGTAVYLHDADNAYAVTVSLSGKVQLWQKRNGGWIAI